MRLRRLWVYLTVQDQDIWASDRLLGAAAGFETFRLALTAMSSHGGCLRSPSIGRAKVRDCRAVPVGSGDSEIKQKGRAGGGGRVLVVWAESAGGAAAVGKGGLAVSKGRPPAAVAKRSSLAAALRTSGEQGALKRSPALPQSRAKSLRPFGSAPAVFR